MFRYLPCVLPKLPRKGILTWKVWESWESLQAFLKQQDTVISLANMFDIILLHKLSWILAKAAYKLTDEVY